MSNRENIYSYCFQFLDKKETELRKALMDLQESAAQETKSSAGDKYETGREMMQQEQNKIQGQIAKLKEQQKELLFLSRGKISLQAGAGSIIYTQNGVFLLGPAIGKIETNEGKLMCISTRSPLGQQFEGRTIGDQFELNGLSYVINSIE